MDNVTSCLTRHDQLEARAAAADPPLVLSSRLLEVLWVEAQARAAQLPTGQHAWWRWQAAARALTVALCETERLAGTSERPFGRRDWSRRPAEFRTR